MRLRFSDIARSKLATDAGTFPVRDLVFDPDARTLHSVLVDIGGLLRSTEALVHARRLGPTNADGHLTTSLAADDVLSAPQVEQDHESHAPTPDITDWPPIIVGPFGTAQGPLLLAAQLFGAGTDGSTTLPDRLERWSDWADCLVFGPDGPGMKIADIEVDLPSGRMTSLTLARDGKAISRPPSVIRSFVARQGYAVSDLTDEEILLGHHVQSAGPNLPETDGEGWVATDKS